jgi:hypothetical protein
VGIADVIEPAGQLHSAKGADRDISAAGREIGTRKSPATAVDS